MRVGEVEHLRFVRVEQPCDALTEDSRADERTDACDPHAFCSPDGTCAELEPYAGRGVHAPCLSSDDCDATEVCVEGDAATRLRDGPTRVCASWVAPYPPVEASMWIDAAAIPFVAGSAAVTATNHALQIDLVAGPPSTPSTALHERRPPLAPRRAASSSNAGAWICQPLRPLDGPAPALVLELVDRFGIGVHEGAHPDAPGSLGPRAPRMTTPRTVPHGATPT